VEHPRLKAHFRAIVSADDVYLAAEDRHFLVRGPGAAAVLPYLDGRHTIADIAIALGPALGPADVLRAVTRYRMYDALADGRPDLRPAELAYWDAFGVGTARLAALAAVPVTVLAVGGADAGPVTEALTQAGVRARRIAELPAIPAAAPETEAAAGGLLVAVTDDYLRPELAAINDAMLAAGGRWVLIKPTGLEPWIGPLFEPGATGCWTCLRHRLNGNRQVERYLIGMVGDHALVPEHPPAIAPAATAAAGLLAGELARVIVSDGSPVLHGTMVTIDLRTLRTDEHTLIRRPQCRSCGDPGLMTQREPKVTIQSRPVSHWTAGGLRTQDLAATFDRLSRHISPYLGAVSSLFAYGETYDGLVATYCAGHNFAMMNNDIGMLRRNLRGQSGGKGKSEIQGKVSAVCEAIERYAAVCDGDEPVVRAAYADLGPDQAVHPAELMLFSPAQYEHRKEWNRDPAHRLQSVPEPFRTDLPVDWTPAWSLTHERRRLVPAAYAWYGHPDAQELFYCFADSNGTAAGNCLEEAIVQGFCELAERDAVALWWYNRLRRPAVELDSVHDPYVDALRGHGTQPVDDRHHLRPGHPHLLHGLAPDRPRERGHPGGLRRPPGPAHRGAARADRAQPVPARRRAPGRRRQHRLRRGRRRHAGVVARREDRGRAMAVPGRLGAGPHARRLPGARRRRHGELRGQVRPGRGGVGRRGHRARPVQARHGPGGGPGDGPRHAALLAPAGPRAAVRRAGHARLARRADA
jgi:oxazoline/thiazoline synthase